MERSSASGRRWCRDSRSPQSAIALARCGSRIRTPASKRWFSFGGLTPQLSRPEIVLKRDRAFQRMTRFLEAEMYPRERKSICMGCRRYEVTATLIGRVDHVAGRGGFGHMNGYKTRLLLQSVAEVSTKENAGAYDPAEFSGTEVRFPEGTIRGTLLDAQGKPLPDREVNAVESEPGSFRSRSETRPIRRDAFASTFRRARTSSASTRCGHAEYGGYNVVGHAVSHTDADGRFTLVGFESCDYVIHANIYAQPAYFHCAATVRLNAEDATPEVIPFVLSITGQVCR